MTYKEFISKLEDYSFFMLHFEKESEEYLILYIEISGEVPIAALSLVHDDWKFINQSASVDATFLGAMAELADTPKEQRGDWEYRKGERKW
ncbi:hypothetical protein [Lactobacillus delbrueckii]|uniref:hypothetical protein n=1 Tax=Lactobacillus delbrueckii TaxID=1584 RepID=UPI003A8497AB